MNAPSQVVIDSFASTPPCLHRSPGRRSSVSIKAWLSRHWLPLSWAAVLGSYALAGCSSPVVSI